MQTVNLAPLPDLYVVVRTDTPARLFGKDFLLSTWHQGRPGVLWYYSPTVFMTEKEALAFAADHRDLCPDNSTNWRVVRYECGVVPPIPSDPEPTPKTVTISLDPTVPCGFLLTSSDGRTAISTLDQEFPSLARSFGWSLTAIRWEKSWCKHIDTDGSFDCPMCGLPVPVMIDPARKYLMDNCPITVPDPGYFA